MPGGSTGFGGPGPDSATVADDGASLDPDDSLGDESKIEGREGNERNQDLSRSRDSPELSEQGAEGLTPDERTSEATGTMNKNLKNNQKPDGRLTPKNQLPVRTISHAVRSSEAAAGSCNQLTGW